MYQNKSSHSGGARSGGRPSGSGASRGRSAGGSKGRSEGGKPSYYKSGASGSSGPRRSFSAGKPRSVSGIGNAAPSRSTGSSSGRSGGYSSSPRRSFGGGGGSRPRHGGGGGNRSRGRFAGKAIDVSKFINKVAITEVAEVFVPAHHFNDFHIEQALKGAIAKREFILPTPIQDKVIPHILDGQDVVGLANTGTGKTAAFLIPLINKVIKDKNQKAIIIAPTRELAQQIDEELKLFTRTMGIMSAVCVGGTNMSKQLRDLGRYHNFVIGTPGRIKDMVERKKIDLSKFQSIVLDEADRMLDMGFVNDMRFVMEKMPADRHSLFFSATLPKGVADLVSTFLRNPVTVSVKTQETSKNIEQDVIKVSREKKFDELAKLLSNEEFKKVLVFGRTKHGVEKLSKDLFKLGFKADSIHGDKTQAKRQKTLNKFKLNEISILLATDVAARGLDIDDITHVINYDVPESHEDYVHRIGRTGRGNKKGKALTFID